ncbi:MAG: hypothetical protein ABI472_12105 [Ginsengibacter sp.]
MQKFIKVLCSVLLVSLSACHSKKVKQASLINTTKENKDFFPVTDFLLGQLNEIDSLSVTPLKITISEGKRDSVWLTKKDIRVFALPFLQPVIDSISMKNYFTEVSFLDQTINAITLTYDPKIKIPDSIKLSHWDIYINPQQSKVQKIYLVKEENIIGGTKTTQLTWKVNAWCSIRTITEQPNSEPRIKEEIMKWDLDD